MCPERGETEDEKSMPIWSQPTRAGQGRALRRWRQEAQEFKVILTYVMSARLAWDTGDPVSEKKRSHKRQLCEFCPHGFTVCC